jgi:hypothetical protein
MSASLGSLKVERGRAFNSLEWHRVAPIRAEKTQVTNRARIDPESSHAWEPSWDLLEQASLSSLVVDTSVSQVK